MRWVMAAFLQQAKVDVASIYAFGHPFDISFLGE
jgi:hypothetical protein